MRKSEFKILYIEFFLLITFFFNIFVSNFFSEYSISLILILCFIGLVFLLGFEKDSFIRTKDIILFILIFVISYYLVIYLSGLFFGFLRNGYSRKLINIIRNTFPVLAFIASKELLRYQINIKGEKNKLILLLSVIIFVLVDINNVLFLYDLKTASGIFELLEVQLLPIIAENLLLTYCSIKSGYRTSIIYLLLMRIPKYLVPIMPDLGEYLEIILNLIFPVIVLFALVKTDKKYQKSEKKIVQSKFVSITYYLSVALLVMVVYLTSNLFSYYAITIGSESMTPKIDKGDVVIVKKVKKTNDLRVGDILVYNKDYKTVVHRIVQIREEGNEFIYTTKGDANNEADDYPVYERDIQGVVKFKFKFIGYPTIWLNELIN